jgi:cytochrome P450
MTDLTLRAIIRGFFSVDLGGETSEFPQAVATIIDCLAHIGFVQFNLPQQVQVTSRQQFQDSMGVFDRFVDQVVRARMRGESRANDLLSCLLKEYSEPSGELTAEGRRRVRDEMVTLIVAGHETTATAIIWTWHLVSQYPDIEQRLHRELDTVLAGRLVQSKDLPHLPFLHRVLQESMRVRPPVWFIGRKSNVDDVVMGVEIPAGSPVIVSPYTMHRHPEFWPSPDEFDPDRFLPERAAGREQYAYVPFAGGRHLCIGNHLSMLEARLIIAAVAQKFRLRAVDGHVVIPEPLFTLRPRGGLPMIPERR